MKVFNISIDNSVLNKNSSLAKRVVEYGNLVDEYTIIVPDKESKEIKLSEYVQAYGVKSSNKLVALYKIYSLAKKILNKEKYDIITVQDQYYLALVSLMLAKKFQLGLEIQIHGWEKFFGLRKLVARFVISKADAIRTVSQRLKKQLIDKFGVKEEKITVVPIYIERVTHNIERVTHNNKFIFLTVGRLVSVKNIKMQIKAMANVVAQNFAPVNKKLELWIIGDGEEKEKLKVLSFKFQVSENVKFFGWQDDLEKFYQQADAFLLTSDYEGWGMVVIEAASYGLPIIMTDVGCAGEIIRDGESGLVIPVGEHKKLAEAMIRLIQDRELGKKLGEKARQAILQLPSKEETLELYRQSWQKALIKK